MGAACTAMMNKFKPLKKYSNANDLDLIMEKVEPIVLAFERQMEAHLSKKKKEVLKKIGLEIRETVAQQVRASGNNFNPDVVIKSLGTAFQKKLLINNKFHNDKRNYLKIVPYFYFIR